jgi:c-di-GMP-binding flagellar brake protein YcgR
MRKHKRVKAILGIEWSPHSNDDIKVSMHSSDISEGGVRVFTLREPVVGSMINVFLKFKEQEEAMIIPATVVRADKMKDNQMFDVGIQFSVISRHHADSIREYVEENGQDEVL